MSFQVSDVSDKLGKLLLQGWTMTEVSCPDAVKCGGTPLMRPRNEEHMLCVSCNRWFLRQADGSVALEHQEPEPPAEQPEVAPKEPAKEEVTQAPLKKRPVHAEPQQQKQQPRQEAMSDEMMTDEDEDTVVMKTAMARLMAVIDAQSASLQGCSSPAQLTAVCQAIEAAAKAYEKFRSML